MLRQIVKCMLVLAVVGGMAVFVGCETQAQNDALLGSAIGAGIGALAGGDSEGALIGAAIGGGVGYVASENKATKQEMASIRADQNIVSVWITNSNGSLKEVTLRKSGPGFIGPRSEYYPKMPTEEALRQVYGF